MLWLKTACRSPAGAKVSNKKRWRNHVSVFGLLKVGYLAAARRTIIAAGFAGAAAADLTSADFVLGTGPDIKNGDFEIQVFASHGVVYVHFNSLVIHSGGNAREHMAFVIAHAHGLAKLNFEIRREGFTVKDGNQAVVKFTIGIRSQDVNVLDIANLHACEGIFQTWDQVLVPMQILEGVGFDFLAVNNQVIGHLHDRIILYVCNYFCFHFSPILGKYPSNRQIIADEILILYKCIH
jgi:hypothetical protein